MIQNQDAKQFLEKACQIPFVDVRSPKEYQQGHIPGAYNIPLFENDERAVVGTIYKYSGRESAILKALDIVGPKMSGFVKQAGRITVRKSVLLHCWRGGMRSENMAWLLSMAGFNVFVLSGGYKAYRKFIRTGFEKNMKYLVLAGYTGSGKTEILENLTASGHQVLHLEKIASHKGSAFGQLDQAPQPTNEQFENDLYENWHRFAPSKTVWLEDESKAIGKVNIPEPLFLKIRQSKIVFVDMEKSLRIKRLVNDYASCPPDKLKSALYKIEKKLGGQKTKEAVEAIDKKDFSIAVEIILNYYDKTYRFGLQTRKADTIYRLKVNTPDARENADRIINFCKSLQLL